MLTTSSQRLGYCLTRELRVQPLTLQQRLDALARQGEQRHLERMLKVAQQQRLRHVRTQTERERRRSVQAPQAPPAQHRLYAPRPKLAGFSPDAVLVCSWLAAAFDYYQQHCRPHVSVNRVCRC